MYGAEESESAGIIGTYEIFKSEADVLYKKGNYQKAIESYTTALKLRPEDRISLVCRSRCFLMLGDTTKALQDAEASLVEDKNYHKGMFQKAEALYNQGDFEMGLVYYHRGNRLRPELQNFRLGIQKAQEAIFNCVGTPDRVKLNTTGDLSFFKAQEDKKQKRKGFLEKQRQQTGPKKTGRVERSAQNEKIIQQMLGELYGDKQYLEKLYKETEVNNQTGMKVHALAEEGLAYLDTRTEFWQQVKPMYARKYESRLALNRGRQAKTSPHEYFLQEMEKIEHMVAENNFDGALKRSQKVMSVLDGYSDSQISSKMTFKASLYGIMGNSYLEMGDHEKAAKHHLMDLNIGEEMGIEEAESRGLDNVGRVYARMGKFQNAIDVWERKLPMSKTALETTWLCHELGRCYLELGKPEISKNYGDRSLEAAEEAEDDVWQLHALVLISQSEVRSGRLSSSLENFERAYDLATLLTDTAAQAAIKKAIDEVNEKISKRSQVDIASSVNDLLETVTKKSDADAIEAIAASEADKSSESSEKEKRQSDEKSSSDDKDKSVTDEKEKSFSEEKRKSDQSGNWTLGENNSYAHLQQKILNMRTIQLQKFAMQNNWTLSKRTQKSENVKDVKEMPEIPDAEVSDGNSSEEETTES